MKPQVQFGRRAPPPLRLARTAGVELTPAQRALFFAPDDGAAAAGSAAEVAPWSRGAGLIACAVASAFAVALSLARQGAEPPDAFAMAFRLFSIASNISLSCWLAHKICGWRGLSGYIAYGLAGAGVNLSLSWLGAQLGLGESELGYAADALAGGGAALLYLLLAGRKRVT